MVLFLYAFISEVPPPVLTVLDAAWLSLFAVAGAEKALVYRIGPLLAALMGAITGVGGGIVRYLLLVKFPSVLHEDVYACAAIVGAPAMIVGQKAGVRPWVAATVGALLCFAIRLLAAWRHWSLPKLT